MAEIVTVLGTTLVCFGVVLTIFVLFALMMRGDSVQRELTYRQFEPFIDDQDREKLLQIAGSLGLSLMLGSVEPPLTPQEIERPFLHDKIIERHCHMMQGTQGTHR